MTYLAIFCAGGWISAIALNSIVEPRQPLPTALASAIWPVYWLVVAGLLIRAAMLKWMSKPHP
jgi:hypothetical protein